MTLVHFVSAYPVLGQGLFPGKGAAKLTNWTTERTFVVVKLHYISDLILTLSDNNLLK